VRKNPGAATSHVQSKLLVKKMIENPIEPACAGLNYPNGLSKINFRHNSATPILGGWVLTNNSGKNAVSSTLWRSSPLYDAYEDPFDASVHLAHAKGFEFQLRIHSLSTSASGTKISTDLDDLRAEVRT